MPSITGDIINLQQPHGMNEQWYEAGEVLMSKIEAGLREN